MKLKEMLPEIPYIVTKGSPGTFSLGDHVRMEDDGAICCKEAHGWLGKEDWRNLRTKVRIDIETLEKRVSDARHLLAKAEADLEYGRLHERKDD